MYRREAIRECKKLWEEIEKSRLSKMGFLNSPGGEKWWDKHYRGECPLCEYAFDLSNGCPKCPLVKQYGKDCFALGYSRFGRSPSFFEAVRGLNV